MNDNDLGLALERLVAERKRIGPSPALQQAVWTIPATTPPERRWLPRIDTTGGFTMLSALKFAAASAIVALLGGFLLAGILSTPRGDEGLPGAVTGSSEPLGGTVQVRIEGIKGAAGSRMVAILNEDVEGPAGGLGAFAVDITSDPFSVTDKIREGLEWWDSTTEDPVVDVPPGTYRLRIWVSSNLGPYNDWVPAEPIEAGCMVPLTVNPGGPESVVIVDIPAWDGRDQPCGLEAPDAPSTEPIADVEIDASITTEALLGGMVAEEVEPGVFRVVNDGYRDLGHSARPFVFRHDVVIPDGAGGVWRVMPEGRFYRIGEEPEWTFDPGLVAIDQSNTEATPDGRLVTVGVIGVKFFRDGSWGDGEYGHDKGLLGDVVIGDDGMVWLLDPEDATLYWYGPGQAWSFSSWKDVYGGEVRGDEMVVVGGDVWLVAGREEYGAATDAFLRFDGADWEVVDAPDGLVSHRLSGDGSTFGVAPSGVLWTAGDAGTPLHRSLARYDGTGWTVFGETDGVRPWSGNQRLWVPWEFGVDMLRVAPDGSAWVNAAVPVSDSAEEVVCDGLGRYDGEGWSSYLSGRCVWDYDFAPDGSLWVVAKEGTGPSTEDEQAGLAVHTYVITPEAVAAAG